MNDLYFSVKAGLKDVIGRDLITDDNIAIFELVKNSFDAHAKEVVITFEDSKIIIADDGKGMSLKDLTTKWLAVAYSAKNDDTEDLQDDNNRKSYRNKIKARQHYAGAKGIGRFSCDRLGKKLVLTTRKNGFALEQLTIFWNKFEKDQKKDFEKVNVQHETLNGYHLKFPKKSKYGTIIEIEGAAEWEREKIKELKHSLEKLIDPFSDMADFSIQIISEKDRKMDESGINEKGKSIVDRDIINGKVSNTIIDILKMKTTKIDVKILNNKIDTKLFDRDTLIYHIEENNKFHLFIEDLSISLYYLNRSAKMNFKKKMGIEPVNYGSVFLFKNGFRVQPYGNTGDDSWRLDFRKQQGYNRFLSSREVLGRVSITTDNKAQFREVSSRDGGLVETEGYSQLIEAFLTKGLKRLERYVTGVLWGEAFKRNSYFNSSSEAQKFREALLMKDKDTDNASIAMSNVGSKIDFIHLVRSLSDEKDVKIIKFNKDLVDLVNENLIEVEPRFIEELEKIAKKTGDIKLQATIIRTENAFRKLQQEKEIAEKNANTAKSKQEKAERNVKKAEEKRIKAEGIAKKREEQLKRSRAAETIEYKDLRDSNHIIGVYSDDISKKILLLKRKMDKVEMISREELLLFLKGIGFVNEKITTLTRFTTKSNFLEALLETKEDIINYIHVYLKDIYKVMYPDSDIEFITNNLSFIKSFEPIELCMAIDNILSNSRKKKARKIIFEFYKKNEKLYLSIKDIGKPLDTSIIDYNMIFEEGLTTTQGSGLGLSHVKRIIEKNMGGKVIYNPKYKDGFELIITF